MKIIYKHGDLLRAPERYIVHGCNAQGVMGSGVAKLLRDADERVFDFYRQQYERQGGCLYLGQVVEVFTFQNRALSGKVVFNAVTQERFGREPGVTYVDYEGVAKAMRTINHQLKLICAQVSPPPGLAMPLIGAGLAQGRWSILSQIIEAETTHCQPVVYLVDGVIPDGVEGEVTPA